MTLLHVMSAKPKRRWMRFHLSTALLLMLASGALLWANMHETFFVAHEELASTGRNTPVAIAVQTGFPFVHYRWLGRYMYCSVQTDSSLPLSADFLSADIREIDSIADQMPQHALVMDDNWIQSSLILNVLICVFSLIVLGVVSEFLLRQRKAADAPVSQSEFRNPKSEKLSHLW